MADEKSPTDRVAELGHLYRERLIENMAKVVGNRPQKATRIGPKRELELWIMPTSPAATIALERGATLQEAEQANAMWAQQMKADGATDEQVFQTCRKFAFQRGKFHSHGDPEKETAWHDRMAERAARYRAGGAIETDEGNSGEGAGNGGSNDWGQ